MYQSSIEYDVHIPASPFANHYIHALTLVHPVKFEKKNKTTIS